MFATWGRGLLAALGVALLASCGGGGPAAGAKTSFSTLPDKFTATGAIGSCGAGAQTVFINGGAPPYLIENTSPAYVAVSTTVVNADPGTFDVVLLGTCGTFNIGIRDSWGQVITFTAISELGA